MAAQESLNKVSMRDFYRQRRKEFCRQREEKLAAENKIILHLEEYGITGTWLGYWPLAHEVDLGNFFCQSQRLQNVWVFPAGSAEHFKLLKPQTYAQKHWVFADGFWQPHIDFSEPVNISSLTGVLVPVVAIDREGFRLGQGGGYFDRLLAECPPHVKRVAVGFECQISNQPLLREPWDQAVDALVTETGWCDFSSERVSGMKKGYGDGV